MLKAIMNFAGMKRLEGALAAAVNYRAQRYKLTVANTEEKKACLRLLVIVVFDVKAGKSISDCVIGNIKLLIIAAFLSLSPEWGFVISNLKTLSTNFISEF